jgi:hypothetical protein
MKLYKCDYCEKEYKSLSARSLHYNLKHKEQYIRDKENNKNKKHTCNMCNKYFSCRQSKHVHKKTCLIKKTDIKTNIKIDEKSKLSIETQTDNNYLLNKPIQLSIDNVLNDNEDFNIKKHSYVYLIEKYDLNNDEFIYKFGKSNRHIYQRLNEHGKEAKIILIIEVDDCNIIEKKILNILINDDSIIKKKNIGNEYFYCENKTYIKQLIFNNI